MDTLGLCVLYFAFPIDFLEFFIGLGEHSTFTDGIFKGIKTDLKEAKEMWLWNCTALCRCSFFFKTRSDASMKVIINKKEHISREAKYIHT